MAKNEKSGIEFIESAEALQKEIGKAEGFLAQNKKVLGIVGGVVLVAALAVVGYKYWVNQQNQEAETAMFDSVYYFESDSLDLALNGTGGNMGLIEVADQYGNAPAGNLAKFYVGLSYMKQGKFDEAINYLNDFSVDDIVLQGKSYALIGDAYLEKGDAAQAATYYEKAASYKPSKSLTPGYLMKLATAQEVAGNKAAALEAYTEIVNEYPNSSDYLAALKYKSMLETETGE
ncbi:tetratricopeptide repeat protein [Marinilongibacter aquaticus]|uniref:tetratricopeptide repeat protein n=1 Tax=Marinilongibacter aquaticus TaxID=2975157 RepID=UPI0021BD4244|nr:tetratricopeptide repeat protein [Marinilongibacter aquaticus]UBM57434.1 tetratricopeptide repeat protein [Marinilongibacter aquaticus]